MESTSKQYENVPETRKYAKGEKPLLIINFVHNIAPQDEEETLGSQGNGNAKLVVTYAPKKPTN